MRFAVILVMTCGVTSVSASAQNGGIRGASESVTAAEKLLAYAGGGGPWTKRSLATTQSVYLRTGEIGSLKIWRDFERRIRRLERTTPTETFIEWISPDGGWTSTNGRVQKMSPEELAFRLQGLKQEPYAIYHRVAKRDPALRVELRDNNRTLAVFDHDERLLSWFSLDDARNLIGWGSYFNGNQNQHYYLSKTESGNVFLPKYGVVVNGSYRFEYLSANMSDEAVTEPVQPQ